MKLVVAAAVLVGAVPVARAGGPIRIDAAALQSPIVVEASAAYGRPAQHKFPGTPLNCQSRMTDAPIATFELTADDVPVHLEILRDATASWDSAGMILVKGEQLFCSAGNNSRLDTIPGGWKRGVYQVYAIDNTFSNSPVKFTLEIYDPKAAPRAHAGGPHVVLDKAVATPMLVPVTLQPKRRRLPANLAKYAEDNLMPDEADLVIEVARPLPGLSLRALPTAEPILVSGVDDKGLTVGSKDGSRIELKEGTYHVSLGSKSPKPTEVTLMIYDQKTAFDPVVRAPALVTATLEDRVLARQFPQLATSQVHTDGAVTFAKLELAAKLWKALPPEAFVYAKLDFDDAIVGGAMTADAGFPVKDEQLMLVSLEHDTAFVLTADGNEYRTNKKYLLLAPSGGAPVLPTEPRAFRGTSSMYDVIHLLPPGHKARAAYEKKMAAFDACRAKAWEPYGSQLPVVMPGYEIAAKSPEYVRIENAGLAAQDKSCGTKAAFDKKIDKDRTKLLGELAAARKAQLAALTGR